MNRLRLTAVCDAVDEGWPSMELAAEMLLMALNGPLAGEVQAEAFWPELPQVFRRVPLLPRRLALNADRLLGRWVAIPREVRRAEREARFFHVVDHSYAHLVHELPAERTGVYCHDLDAFRSLFEDGERRPGWFRAMARKTLEGMQRAAVVFHSTLAMREELIARNLVDPARLVHAPFGVAAEFSAVPTQGDRLPASLEGRPYLLHVGSALPRKRLDVLFRAFALVRETHPDLLLVQQGATLDPSQRALVSRLRIGQALVQPPEVLRSELACLYRRARLVLLPSDAEGFGFPILEALACGAPVLASDLPTLREVGGNAVRYVPPGQPEAWAAAIRDALSDPSTLPPPRVRFARAGTFSWMVHGRAVLDAYLRLERGAGEQSRKS